MPAEKTAGAAILHCANQHQHSAGRSSASSSPRPHANRNATFSPLAGPPSLFTSSSNLQALSTSCHGYHRYGGTGLSSSSSSSLLSYNDQHRKCLRSTRQPAHQSTNAPMTSYTSTTTAPAVGRSSTSHGRLHKRGGSGSASASSLSLGGYSQPSLNMPVQETSLSNTSVTPSLSSTPKIKPYLRKMSSAKEDQGQIDLSLSLAENEKLTGLGIRDFSNGSAGEVLFAPANTRKRTHARTTSVSSQMSTGSGSFRPSQPFVHPMRQTPRPFTPPTGHSYASSLNDEEANESSDVIDDEFRLGHGYRTRRSMSISSTAQTAPTPTPLSQSHTASDLGLISDLTHNTSQSNLSIKSSRSGRTRPRRDTGRSQDLANSPSSRTSLDKAFSFVSRRSDTDVNTRDERIRAARRKFEEKEAEKDRKAGNNTIKRRETAETSRTPRSDRKRSETFEQPARPTSSKSNGPKKIARRKREGETEKFDAKAYEGYRPSNEASLPIRGKMAGGAILEKTPTRTYQPKPARSGWVHFSTWLRTRLCGGGRD